VAGGCEAAVHSASLFLQNMPSDHVLVKLDFNNAFNCLHRRNMLQAISDRLPELLLSNLTFFNLPCPATAATAATIEVIKNSATATA